MKLKTIILSPHLCLIVVRMIFQPGQVLFVNQDPGHRVYDQFRTGFTLSKVKASAQSWAVVLQDWIYRQLCETTTPLHPQLLPLIDVYINSILTPASKSNPEATNQPVTEQEILNVFQGLSGVIILFGSFLFFMGTWFRILDLC